MTAYDLSRAWQRSRAAITAGLPEAPVPVPDRWDPVLEQGRLNCLLADLAAYAHASGLTFLPGALGASCAVNRAARTAYLVPLPFPEPVAS